MKDEIREKIAAAVGAWEYIQSLPESWLGFELEKEMKVSGDVYDLYSYENKDRHRRVTVYYHDETKEYKVRVRIGLTEFCRIEFIADNLNKLEDILRERFAGLLEELMAFRIENISCIVREKRIPEWAYTDQLPAVIDGFVRFIEPHEPVKAINGSYIILDYSDFATHSNFILYYNVFRDEFFGEAKIHDIPEMNYTFDATELVELEEKMDRHFFARLKELRSRIDDKR